jgi:hypothetical protein
MATETVQQIVREAPEIETLKRQLMEQAQGLALSDQLKTQLERPEAQYRIAGFDPTQQAAIQAAEMQGIGAFAPYMQSGSQALQSAYSTTAEAADILRGSDVRRQFADAQQALSQAGGATAAMTKGLPLLGEAQTLASSAVNQPGFGRGVGANYTAAEQARLAAAQPGFDRGIGALYGAADYARLASSLGQAPTIDSYPGVTSQGISAAQTGYNPNLQMFQMGAGPQVGTGSFTRPGAAEAYMSPYMQNVLDAQMREIQRQDDIARQGRSARAVASGAFGGTRAAVEEAEAARNLAQLKSNVAASGLQQAFQQGQQQFNVEEQARLAAQQANQQAGLTAGSQNLAAALGVQQLGTQTGLQTAMANLSNEQQARIQNEANRLQAQGMNQQAALQTAMANQQMLGQYGITQAQMGQQTAEMLRQAGLGEIGVAGQQAALGQQAAQQLAQAGALEAGTSARQAELQQQAAQIYGSLAGQTAGIYGQQAQQLQGLGQGIGSLAGQQFGIGAQMAAGLGGLGQQLGGLGIQAGALGQTAQGLAQGDINFLYNIGQARQALEQQKLDAQRASAMQQIYVPYQQAAFLSDIYRGAPSTQMQTSAASTPQPSPFQQIVGTGLGAAATYAGIKKLGSGIA